MQSRRGSFKSAALLALVFAAGWVGGATSQRPVSAQIPGVATR
ncbi:MAG: hypothetical protein AB1689_09135 [Thermodesulfobacteriota bacterium]